MADAADDFLDALGTIAALNAGTPETSFYPAISALLNAVGVDLAPRVLALNHPTGKRAGIPDFGLFVAPARRAPPPAWGAGIPAERGVVEVKPPTHDIAALCAGEQVRRYATAYGLVLATNLRQWRLVDTAGTVRESFDLAPDPAAFDALRRARTRPETLRTRFLDFLQRCLLTNAPLARPPDVAFFLASYARDALALLTDHATLPALATLRGQMERALGVTFEPGKGERLFRSTLVQTLFYGVFSAWASEAREGRAATFDWRTAHWQLTVPVAQLLFQQVATPAALGPLRLVPLLDAAQAALRRVVVAEFFRDFDATHAIQYFYEPFLRFYDPQLREDLGVWYTPPEIVEYMVERVDRVLRTELGRPEGLADDDVWVLDPCCGTGSFPLAVLDRIRRTLESGGLGDLAAERLHRAATTRVVGFEIMTAPFLIAHWQIGEALRRWGAPLATEIPAGGNAAERAAIYLTNALTGWTAPTAGAALPGFEALTEEGAAAGAVKRRPRLLVVIGNPPYNAFAGTAPESEGGLVEPYKAGLARDWGVRKFNLDDLYVRFFRVAERRVAETTGEGVVCFISNFSWLNGASFTVMRRRLLEGFDAVWVDNLNGDSRETGKLTPAGAPDPSAFSTDLNREGIRVGTAVVTLVRHADPA